MALKRDSLIEITDKSSKSEKVSCIWIKFLGIVLVAQKFRFQWQTFNGEKKKVPQESTAIELSSSLSTNVFRFFFSDRARRHPLAFARAPTRRSLKRKYFHWVN